MTRRALFWKLLVSLVALTLVLSWIERNAQLPPFVGILALLLLAMLTSALLARYLARPLAQMRRAAQAQAAGKENVQWPAPTTNEMGALSSTVQAMALDLQEKIHTIENLLSDQRAIFDSMAEGVLVVDTQARLLDMNRAAREMLSVTVDEVAGRDVLEVARNARLVELVHGTLADTQHVVESDISLFFEAERHLQIHGSVLRGAGGIKGALLVMTDVTRLRQLETLQREFVSNASHELKTPLTSIRGFAETLAAEKELDAEQTQRFTRIIARQSEQLSALIDDLMELTRIEYEQERAPLERSLVGIRETINAVLEARAGEANQKNIALSTDADPALQWSVHPVLMQRVLVNLVDNAIKYSSAHTTIAVNAEADGDEVRVSVRDQGMGIAPEHQRLVFERFYRVDKSRSRKLGGTGLGLSIVKHIVEVHGGRVTLVSSPGQGSAFTIHLPK